VLRDGCLGATGPAEASFRGRDQLRADANPSATAESDAWVDALRDGVEDEGLQALADAGAGKSAALGLDVRARAAQALLGQLAQQATPALRALYKRAADRSAA
jgi:hypothetical protein